MRLDFVAGDTGIRRNLVKSPKSKIHAPAMLQRTHFTLRYQLVGYEYGIRVLQAMLCTT